MEVSGTNVRPVTVVVSHIVPFVVRVHVPDPICMCLAFELLDEKLAAVTSLLFASNFPKVSTIFLVARLSCNCHLPPEPLNVILPVL